MANILDAANTKIRQRLQEENLLEDTIRLRAKVLSAQEAIGNPEKYDFPLLKGKEKIMEAEYKGHLGHAFTDMYGGFEGALKEVFEMPSSNNYRRALQVATANALCRYWGLVQTTVHCKDQQPAVCAGKCVAFIQENYPKVKKIALVGYQPALIDTFSRVYTLKVFDLDEDNIGEERFGQVILDGRKDSDDALKWADLVLATGTTLVNGTIDAILDLAGKGKVIFFGVTIAGAAELLGLNRICFSQ